MLTLQLKGEEDLYRVLIRIERTIDQQSDEFLETMGEWIVDDIQTHWFPTSPSPKQGGTAPAVDTGNLDSSVRLEQGFRGSGGRFASKAQAKTLFIRVNTAEGDNPMNRGNYAVALEEGTGRMAERPFLAPAMERASHITSFIAKATFKL